MVLSLVAVAVAQEEGTAPKGNICYTENVEVEKGTSFPVKVFVNNVDTLAGMQVPIYYRSDVVDLKCDSMRRLRPGSAADRAGREDRLFRVYFHDRPQAG